MRTSALIISDLSTGLSTHVWLVLVAISSPYSKVDVKIPVPMMPSAVKNITEINLNTDQMVSF